MNDYEPNFIRVTYMTDEEILLLLALRRVKEELMRLRQELVNAEYRRYCRERALCCPGYCY